VLWSFGVVWGAKIEPSAFSIHVARQVVKNVAEELVRKARSIDMFLTEETFLSFSNAGRLKDQRVGLVVE
jgi:hypothetical protein